jgi:hypothetical protein
MTFMQASRLPRKQKFSFLSDFCEFATPLPRNSAKIIAENFTK